MPSTTKAMRTHVGWHIPRAGGGAIDAPKKAARRCKFVSRGAHALTKSVLLALEILHGHTAKTLRLLSRYLQCRYTACRVADSEKGTVQPYTEPFDQLRSEYASPAAKTLLVKTNTETAVNYKEPQMAVIDECHELTSFPD